MKDSSLVMKAYTVLSEQTEPRRTLGEPYCSFDQINGQHPWKIHVPNGYVEYEARILRKSKVAYFNFALAKEMGLVPADHPNRLNPKLEKKLIETFALRIINEYDLSNGVKYPRKDIKPNKYMATRYLQLQHSSRLGVTSGDGRSIWNGYFQAPDHKVWDISSCGTGVTRLSPASAFSDKPIRSGDRKVSYGSGLADLDEGLIAAIMSESLHARGIFTERTLILISTDDSHSINVRAALNLLRPSHLFLHLKQGSQLHLKAALNYYIRREIQNGKLKPNRFLSTMAKLYGEFVARLEDEYIFCWLDWDGDNMLTAGGIIDYGSIRQFGLCHHQYRYDDVNRFSTNLKEQKAKAKYLIQTFIQLVDFVQTGVKRNVRSFANSSYLKRFDRSYVQSKKIAFLRRMGWSQKQSQALLKRKPKLIAQLENEYHFFERQESPNGMRNTPDGVNCPAIFDVHHLLRELPKRYLQNLEILTCKGFLEIMRTPYCTKKILREYDLYEKRAKRFQTLYLQLVSHSSKNSSPRRCLLELTMRSSQNNPTGQATGDGIIYVVDELLEKRKRLGSKKFHQLVDSFIAIQSAKKIRRNLSPDVIRILDKLCALVEENRYSI